MDVDGKAANIQETRLTMDCNNSGTDEEEMNEEETAAKNTENEEEIVRVLADPYKAGDNGDSASENKGVPDVRVSTLYRKELPCEAMYLENISCRVEDLSDIVSQNATDTENDDELSRISLDAQGCVESLSDDFSSASEGSDIYTTQHNLRTHSSKALASNKKIESIANTSCFTPKFSSYASRQNRHGEESREWETQSKFPNILEDVGTNPKVLIGDKNLLCVLKSTLEMKENFRRFQYPDRKNQRSEENTPLRASVQDNSGSSLKHIEPRTNKHGKWGNGDCSSENYESSNLNAEAESRKDNMSQVAIRECEEEGIAPVTPEGVTEPKDIVFQKDNFADPFCWQQFCIRESAKNTLAKLEGSSCLTVAPSALKRETADAREQKDVLKDISNANCKSKAITFEDSQEAENSSHTNTGGHLVDVSKVAEVTNGPSPKHKTEDLDSQSDSNTNVRHLSKSKGTMKSKIPRYTRASTADNESTRSREPLSRNSSSSSASSTEFRVDDKVRLTRSIYTRCKSTKSVDKVHRLSMTKPVPSNPRKKSNVKVSLSSAENCKKLPNLKFFTPESSIEKISGTLVSAKVDRGAPNSTTSENQSTVRWNSVITKHPENHTPNTKCERKRGETTETESVHKSNQSRNVCDDSIKVNNSPSLAKDQIDNELISKSEDVITTKSESCLKEVSSVNVISDQRVGFHKAKKSDKSENGLPYAGNSEAPPTENSSDEIILPRCPCEVRSTHQNTYENEVANTKKDSARNNLSNIEDAATNEDFEKFLKVFIGDKTLASETYNFLATRSKLATFINFMKDNSLVIYQVEDRIKKGAILAEEICVKGTCNRTKVAEVKDADTITDNGTNQVEAPLNQSTTKSKESDVILQYRIALKESKTADSGVVSRVHSESQNIYSEVKSFRSSVIPEEVTSTDYGKTQNNGDEPQNCKHLHYLPEKNTESGKFIGDSNLSANNITVPFPKHSGHRTMNSEEHENAGEDEDNAEPIFLEKEECCRCIRNETSNVLPADQRPVKSAFVGLFSGHKLMDILVAGCPRYEQMAPMFSQTQSNKDTNIRNSKDNRWDFETVCSRQFALWNGKDNVDRSSTGNPNCKCPDLSYLQQANNLLVNSIILSTNISRETQSRVEKFSSKLGYDSRNEKERNTAEILKDDDPKSPGFSKANQKIPYTFVSDKQVPRNEWKRQTTEHLSRGSCNRRHSVICHETRGKPITHINYAEILRRSPRSREKPTSSANLLQMLGRNRARATRFLAPGVNQHAENQWMLLAKSDETQEQ